MKILSVNFMILFNHFVIIPIYYLNFFQMRKPEINVYYLYYNFKFYYSATL